MADGKKEVSKYKIESIENQTYRNLFEEITKCGVRDWTKLDGKYVLDLNHPSYQSYFRLDFIHLFDFLIKWISEGKHRSGVSEAKAKERKQYFRNELNKRAAGLAEVFRLGKNRNIQSSRVKIGVQTAAEFLDIELIHLLSEFLKDCERKKIRLLLHSEYEEDIENFLLDAPRLVAQLQSKSLRPITPDKQEQQLPEQTVTESRFKIERVEGKKKWLDPYNHKELPLVGRKNEIALLDKFVEAEGQFKIWAISGPSGAGKTRLASQWAYDSPVLKGWDCRVLHKEDRCKPEKWSSWSPDRPTLIVIDYMYGFEEVVLKLMGRRLEPTDSKVRLLLLDHVFSKPLHNDKRWGFSVDGSSLNRNEKYFFDTEPLDLAETSDQAEIIKKIIAWRAGINEKSIQIKEAQEFLSNMQAAYHPLFAALLGDAIRLNKDFKVWNRRELINYYLSGEKHLPWEYNNFSLIGRWASHFIAAATARRGMRYRDLIEATKNCKSVPEYFGDVQEICQKVISNDNTVTLKPFEPDILGESFFLKFLKFLEKSPNYQSEFRQIFMAGNENAQIENAIELISFIQRLTRNLLNDDQSQKEIQELWTTLLDFIRPSEFENAKPIRWALTASLIDIIDAIKDKFPERKLISLIKQADPTVFYQVYDPILLEESVFYSMHCYEITSKLEKIKPEFSEGMAALFERYVASGSRGEMPLMFASYYGFNEMINALINREVDIEATLIDGRNALMFASLKGHTETVKILLNTKPDIVQVVDKDGRSALMHACASGHIETIKLLLEKGKNINTRSYMEGYTSLMMASMYGHTETVRLLIDEGAEIDVTDIEKRTALMLACAGGHIETVRLLIDEKKANIRAVDEECRTALFWAHINNNIEVVEFLKNNGLLVYQIFPN